MECNNKSIYKENNKSFFFINTLVLVEIKNAIDKTK